jgi:hypothetical protein
MNIKGIMTKRFCLSLGAAAAVASVLMSHSGGAAPNPEGTGIVFVYFPSMCAAPGDATDCHEMQQPARPGFESMAACSAHAEIQLRLENNPKVMASCMKLREV